MNPRGEGSRRPVAVLIVDDEPGYREMMRWTFESYGVRADVARDGREGIAMAEAGRYALIVTDVTMPLASGLDLLKAVKASVSRAAVVIATGFGTVETAVYAMKNGASDFFLKPFEMARVEGWIREYLPRAAAPTFPESAACPRSAAEGAASFFSPESAACPRSAAEGAASFFSPESEARPRSVAERAKRAAEENARKEEAS